MYTMNDDLSIYVTRGDIVAFSVSAKDRISGKPHTFEPGEIVRFAVYGKKDCSNVVLQKDFPVTSVTQSVDIFLAEEDTKIGEIISKPKDYWYEVVLNPFDNPQTIIGYDDNGTKVFKLFPEGGDFGEYEPEITPEDIPIVDEELDLTSPRPVQNQAIARAFANLQGGYQATHDAVAKLHVTPQMFGAIGDGKADDTSALQMAIDNASTAVSLGSGTYYVSGELFLKSNISILGQGAKIFRASSAGVVANAFRGVGIRNITIEGIEFVSEHNQEPVNTATDGNGKVSNIDALHFQYIENLRVVNCKFSGLTGGIKIDENLDDVTSVINRGLLVDGCVFDDTVFMPIYTGGLSECYIRNCDISATTESTKLCHHIYISSACENFYIFGNSFKGGVGQSINAASAYTGAKAPTKIHIFNNEFTDFQLLLAVIGGDVYFENNVCRSEIANNCFYVDGLGKLRLSNCNISVNTKLFDAQGFDIEIVNCTVKSRGIIFTSKDGSSLVAMGCEFTITNGEGAFSITSNASVKLLFKDCIFNTSLSGNSQVFVSRNAGCVVIVDGCTINNATSKNFATSGMNGTEYVFHSVFTGFENLCYQATEDLIVAHNNTVIKNVL